MTARPQATLAANDDDYGVTYAVYDRDRIPQLMRSPGPVSGGTREEMTMVDERLCILCDEQVSGEDPATWGFQFGSLWFHHRCVRWLRGKSKQIQSATRQDDPDEAGPGMRAVEVTYRYDGKLTRAGEGDDE